MFWYIKHFSILRYEQFHLRKQVYAPVFISDRWDPVKVVLNYESASGFAEGLSPHPIAVFSGCCDEAIDSEFQFISEWFVQRAQQTLIQLGVKDWGLANESRLALESGDNERAQAVDTERGALATHILKAEKNYLRHKIGAAQIAKASIERLIRSDAGDVPAHLVEKTINRLTRTFDKDIWQAEKQLENILEEQKRL